jgi:uncharacterized membrane protein
MSALFNNYRINICPYKQQNVLQYKKLTCTKIIFENPEVIVLLILYCCFFISTIYYLILSMIPKKYKDTSQKKYIKFVYFLSFYSNLMMCIIGIIYASSDVTEEKIGGGIHIIFLGTSMLLFFLTLIIYKFKKSIN